MCEASQMSLLGDTDLVYPLHLLTLRFEEESTGSRFVATQIQGDCLKSKQILSVLFIMQFFAIFIIELTLFKKQQIAIYFGAIPCGIFAIILSVLCLKSTDFVKTALNDTMLAFSWVYLTMNCQSFSPDPISKIPLQLWFILGILYIGLLCMHLLLIFHWMLRVALIIYTSIYMTCMVNSLVISRAFYTPLFLLICGCIVVYVKEKEKRLSFFSTVRLQKEISAWIEFVKEDIPCAVIVSRVSPSNSKNLEVVFANKAAEYEFSLGGGAASSEVSATKPAATMLLQIQAAFDATFVNMRSAEKVGQRLPTRNGGVPSDSHFQSQSQIRGGQGIDQSASYLQTISRIFQDRPRLSRLGANASNIYQNELSSLKRMSSHFAIDYASQTPQRQGITTEQPSRMWTHKTSFLGSSTLNRVSLCGINENPAFLPNVARYASNQRIHGDFINGGLPLLGDEMSDIQQSSIENLQNSRMKSSIGGGTNSYHLSSKVDIVSVTPAIATDIRIDFSPTPSNPDIQVVKKARGSFAPSQIQTPSGHNLVTKVGGNINPQRASINQTSFLLIRNNLTSIAECKDIIKPLVFDNDCGGSSKQSIQNNCNCTEKDVNTNSNSKGTKPASVGMAVAAAAATSTATAHPSKYVLLSDFLLRKINNCNCQSISNQQTASSSSTSMLAGRVPSEVFMKCVWRLTQNQVAARRTSKDNRAPLATRGSEIFAERSAMHSNSDLQYFQQNRGSQATVVGYQHKLTEFYQLRVRKCAYKSAPAVITVLDNLSDKEKNHFYREINRYKDDLMSTVTHDLKTPLNGIISILESAVSQQTLPDVINCLQIARKNGALLTAIINDIQDFQNIRRGEFLINPHCFNLNELMLEIHELIDYQARSKHIEFRSSIFIENLIIFNDFNRIKQIVLNLLGNALKFTFNGYVSFEVTQSSNHSSLIFSISDTGIGINQQLQKEILKPFGTFRHKKNYQHGIGIGLAICQKLVKRVGNGSISLVSQEGKGSTFSFSVSRQLEDHSQSHRTISRIFKQDQFSVISRQPQQREGTKQSQSQTLSHQNNPPPSPSPSMYLPPRPYGKSAKENRWTCLNSRSFQQIPDPSEISFDAGYNRSLSANVFSHSSDQNISPKEEIITPNPKPSLIPRIMNLIASESTMTHRRDGTGGLMALPSDQQFSFKNIDNNRSKRLSATTSPFFAKNRQSQTGTERFSLSTCSKQQFYRNSLQLVGENCKSEEEGLKAPQTPVLRMVANDFRSACPFSYEGEEEGNSSNSDCSSNSQDNPNQKDSFASQQTDQSISQQCISNNRVQTPLISNFKFFNQFSNPHETSVKLNNTTTQGSPSNTYSPQSMTTVIHTEENLKLLCKSTNNSPPFFKRKEMSIPSPPQPYAMAEEEEKDVVGHTFLKSKFDTGTSLKVIGQNRQKGRKGSSSIIIQNHALGRQVFNKYKRILIVDDTGFNVVALKLMLQSFVSPQTEILEAFNGLQALELAQAKQNEQNYVTLILMDVNMPIMDGIEATRRIKKMDRQIAKAAGADSYIEKPVTMNSLISAIEEAESPTQH